MKYFLLTFPMSAGQERITADTWVASDGCLTFRDENGTAVVSYSLTHVESWKTLTEA